VPKILVVDDRKENLFAMEKILKTLNCDLFLADSGNEALSLTLRHDFALILLDVNMPEMDGFELAELLRSNEETQNIPIIFVTAINKEDNSVFKGYESGAVDYLFKPVNVDILLSKVTVFLELNKKKKELESIQAELERSNQSLTEFASVVSHDLKNPLSSIAGLSELLMIKHTDGMNDKGKECIQHILNTAQRMTGLINDLLAFAQLNAQTAHFTQVNLNDVLKDVIVDLGSQIKSSSGHVELLQELPVIKADRTQVYQLFQNLIVNGIKYRHKERVPLVQIFMKPSPDDSTKCCIVVQDNGMGMRENEVSSIFSPFSRLDGARGYEGIGLGLATVTKIIELHHGKIEVSSVWGEGTAFIVELTRD
jgi:two-component system sensor histidine kinase/response regulator